MFFEISSIGTQSCFQRSVSSVFSKYRITISGVTGTGTYLNNTLNKKLWITGKSDVLKSFKNGSLSAQNSQGSIFANNIEFVSLGVETAYYLTEKLGVSLSFSNPVSGRLIYANPSFSGGVFLDIN